MDPRVGVPQEVKVLLRDRFKGSWWSNSTGLNSWDTGGFGGGTLVDFHDEKKTIDGPLRLLVFVQHKSV